MFLTRSQGSFHRLRLACVLFGRFRCCFRRLVALNRAGVFGWGGLRFVRRRRGGWNPEEGLGVEAAVGAGRWRGGSFVFAIEIEGAGGALVGAFMGAGIANEVRVGIVAFFEGFDGEVADVGLSEVGGGAMVVALVLDFDAQSGGGKGTSAAEEPGVFDHLVDELHFVRVGGAKAIEEFFAVGGEEFGIFVVGQAKGFAGEAVLGRVLGGAGEAFGRFRASAEAAVGGVINRVVVRENHTA